MKQGRLDGAMDAYFASPVAADGKIYTVSKAGKVSVIKAAGQWELLSLTDLGEEAWSTPAIGGDHLYIRTQEALYCFGSKA